jgi:hypothetical protein
MLQEVDASVGPAFSKAFGLAPGTASTGRAVAALKATRFNLGFRSPRWEEEKKEKKKEKGRNC